MGGRTVGLYAADEIIDFGVCGVLTAGSEEITEDCGGNATVAALVEEGESFFVVCCLLGFHPSAFCSFNIPLGCR